MIEKIDPKKLPWNEFDSYQDFSIHKINEIIEATNNLKKLSHDHAKNDDTYGVKEKPCGYCGADPRKGCPYKLSSCGFMDIQDREEKTTITEKKESDKAWDEVQKGVTKGISLDILWAIKDYLEALRKEGKL